MLHYQRGAVIHAGPTVPATGVVPVGAADRHFGRPKSLEEAEPEYRIHTNLPDLQRLTQRDSEAQFFERIRQDNRKFLTSQKEPFPEEVPLTTDKFTPRAFPPALRQVEPNYVVHSRLTFEQTNFERRGYDLGFFQPAVSLGLFCFDTLTLPYQLCTRPTQQIETSAGRCLPGDPAPMVLFPPEISISGMAGQVAAGAGVWLGFP
jgi:hypothetical protein